MTPGEIYELKRENFIEKTIENFKFLIDDFNYSHPIHKTTTQDNGSIISDKFHYENKLANRLIIVSNNYHPYDYGFEICVYRPSISINHNDRKMLIYLYKEKQDTEQTYIPSVAKKLKEEFESILTGTTWLV